MTAADGHSDLYNVLGVTRFASEQEVRVAYKRLAKMYHPDRNSEGEVLFKEVSAAYDVLGNEESKQQYDNELNDKLHCAAATRRRNLDEPSSEVLETRTREDEERKRRREPISAYLFVGKEKELFDEQRQRDAESAQRRKQTTRETGAAESSYNIRTMAHNNYLRNEEENQKCQEKARKRREHEDEEKNKIFFEKESRMKNLEQETREEWERELLRMEVEKQREEADRALHEQAVQKQEELERLHFDKLMTEHRRETDLRRQTCQLSELLNCDLSTMTVTSLKKMKTLLQAVETSVNVEISSRHQIFGD